MQPIWYFVFGVVFFIIRSALKLPASGVQANIKIPQMKAVVLMTVFLVLGITSFLIGLFNLFV